MRKVLVFFGVLLLTGCTINYNLDISSDGITENIEGIVSKDEFDTPETDEYADLNIYNFIYNEQYPFSGGKYRYEKELAENNDTVDIKYSYTYLNDFKDSQILNECYNDVLFEETDKLYVIKLSGEFNCLYTDEITVNVTTDYAVINNNANKVKGNTYTWILDEDSTDIEMQILKKENNNNFTPDKGLHYFRLIGIIIFIILCVIIGYIYIRNVKKNSER